MLAIRFISFSTITATTSLENCSRFMLRGFFSEIKQMFQTKSKPLLKVFLWKQKSFENIYHEIIINLSRSFFSNILKLDFFTFLLIIFNYRDKKYIYFLLFNNYQ